MRFNIFHRRPKSIAGAGPIDWNYQERPQLDWIKAMRKVWLNQELEFGTEPILSISAKTNGHLHPFWVTFYRSPETTTMKIKLHHHLMQWAARDYRPYRIDDFPVWAGEPGETETIGRVQFYQCSMSKEDQEKYVEHADGGIIKVGDSWDEGFDYQFNKAPE